MELSGLRFIGLGGAPPGLYDDSQAFPGHPYSTPAECDSAIASYLTPFISQSQSQCVLITHFPTFDRGILPTRGGKAFAGSQSLQDLITANHSSIILHISGHIHIQIYREDYHGTKSINPGSVTFGNYALLTLQLQDRWEVGEVLLKSL